MVREAEWSDAERHRMEALAEYEAGLCACGYHESQKDGHLQIEVKSCVFCAGISRWGRVQAEQDTTTRDALNRQYNDKIPGSVPLPSDGRRTFTRLLGEAEVAAKKLRD